jgi:hypothetical protein
VGWGHTMCHSSFLNCDQNRIHLQANALIGPKPMKGQSWVLWRSLQQQCYWRCSRRTLIQLVNRRVKEYVDVKHAVKHDHSPCANYRLVWAVLSVGGPVWSVIEVGCLRPVWLVASTAQTNFYRVTVNVHRTLPRRDPITASAPWTILPSIGQLEHIQLLSGWRKNNKWGLMLTFRHREIE